MVLGCKVRQVLNVLCLLTRPSGQLSLKQSSVVVVGAGGLGCPALQYLAATGVGLSPPSS